MNTITKEVFLQLLDRLAEAIAIVENDEITYFNNAFQEIFGANSKLKDIFGNKTDQLINWIKRGVADTFYLEVHEFTADHLALEISVLPIISDGLLISAILILFPAFLGRPIERENSVDFDLSEYLTSEVPTVRIEISKRNLQILEYTKLSQVLGIEKLKSFAELLELIYAEDLYKFNAWFTSLLGKKLAVSSCQVRIKFLRHNCVKWVHVHGFIDNWSCSLAFFEMPIASIRSFNMSQSMLSPTEYPFITRWNPTDGVLKEINSALSENLNLSTDQLVGQSFFPLLNPDDRNKMHLLLQSLTPQKPATSPYINQIVVGDQVIHHEWIDFAIFAPDGSLIEMYSMGRPLQLEPALVNA